MKDLALGVSELQNSNFNVTPHRFLQKSKHSDSLQKIVEIVVERGRRVGTIDIGVKFIRIRLDEGRFLQLRVRVEISEAYPVVKADSRSNKYNSKGPEIELHKSI